VCGAVDDAIVSDLSCLISRELRRIRVGAVHSFSMEKIVEGGLHGGSKKYLTDINTERVVFRCRYQQPS